MGGKGLRERGQHGFKITDRYKVHKREKGQIAVDLEAKWTRGQDPIVGTLDLHTQLYLVSNSNQTN